MIRIVNVPEIPLCRLPRHTDALTSPFPGCSRGVINVVTLIATRTRWSAGCRCTRKSSSSALFSHMRSIGSYKAADLRYIIFISALARIKYEYYIFRGTLYTVHVTEFLRLMLNAGSTQTIILRKQGVVNLTD